MIRPTAGHAELFGDASARCDPTLATGRPPGRVGRRLPGVDSRENLDVARRLAGVADAVAVDRRRSTGWGSSHTPIGGPACCRSATCSGWPSPVLCSRSRALILDEPANGLDPAGRDRDPRTAARAGRAAGRDGLHVQPHPGRGRSAGQRESASSIGAADRGARQRCPRAPPGPAARGRGARPRRGRERLRAGGFEPRAARRGASRAARPARSRRRRDRGDTRRRRGAADPLAIARESLEDHFMRAHPRRTAPHERLRARSRPSS